MGFLTGERAGGHGLACKGAPERGPGGGIIGGTGELVGVRGFARPSSTQTGSIINEIRSAIYCAH